MAEAVPLAGNGPSEIRDRLIGDPLSFASISLTHKEKEELEKKRNHNTQKVVVTVVGKIPVRGSRPPIGTRTVSLPSGGGDPPRKIFSATPTPLSQSLEKNTEKHRSKFSKKNWVCV